MKLLKLILLEPRDCFGKKPDGRKTLIKEATRDAPALYATSQLEAYRNFMLIEINGERHSLECFVTPAIVDMEGPDLAALHIVREMSAQACDLMQQEFTKQVNEYMQRNS